MAWLWWLCGQALFVVPQPACVLLGLLACSSQFLLCTHTAQIHAHVPVLPRHFLRLWLCSVHCCVGSSTMRCVSYSSMCWAPWALTYDHWWVMCPPSWLSLSVAWPMGAVIHKSFGGCGLWEAQLPCSVHCGCVRNSKRFRNCIHARVSPCYPLLSRTSLPRATIQQESRWTFQTSPTVMGDVLKLTDLNAPLCFFSLGMFYVVKSVFKIALLRKLVVCFEIL